MSDSSPHRPTGDDGVPVERRWTVQVLFSQREIGVGTPHPLAESLVIGRQPGPQGLALVDGQVSRKHAALQQEGGALVVVDLGSQNGTRVNGQTVDRAYLTDGDLLRLGDSLLLVRQVGEEVEATTTLSPQPTSPPVDIRLPELRGSSTPMRELRAELARAAVEATPVLLVGAPGTDRAAAARAVHRLSGLEGPLIEAQCTVHGTETLLFGDDDEPGLLCAATDGSLFIDAIRHLAKPMQARLVAFLDSDQGARLRLVAGSEVDLVEAVMSDRFAGALYARLASRIIRIPPLRERREDILPLLAAELGREVAKLTPDLAEALVLHHWPFDVREARRLGAELRRRGPGLTALGTELLGSRLAELEAQEAADAQTSARTPSRDELVVMLRRHRGHLGEVATAMGCSEKRVTRWMKTHKLRASTYVK